MFKKNEIKNALLTICKSDRISKEILSHKTDAEQGDGSYIRAFSAKLYSDELLEYLNDNSVAEIPAISFGTGIDLGELGSCATVAHVEQLLNSGLYNNRPERVCRIGGVISAEKEHFTSDTNNEWGKTQYRCVVGEVTYITENGNILTVRETYYSKDGTAILCIRTPDSTIIPSASEVRHLFPEDERKYDCWGFTPDNNCCE